MGRRRGSLSSLLGPLRVTMVCLGEPLGESWGVTRPCERFGEPLGTPWGAFGDALRTLWRLLRSLRGRLGKSWGASRGVKKNNPGERTSRDARPSQKVRQGRAKELIPSWKISVSPRRGQDFHKIAFVAPRKPWEPLGTPWGVLGSPCGAVEDALGGHWGRLGGSRGRLGGPKGQSIQERPKRTSETPGRA